MNPISRIGESFRTEFSRQGTVAYVISMIFFLTISGLVVRGTIPQRWGMFVSPGGFIVLPFADNRQDFWKRFCVGIATYAFFYILIFAIPDRAGFLNDKPHLQAAFYITAVIMAGCLQFAFIRRFFPPSATRSPINNEETPCQ